MAMKYTKRVIDSGAFMGAVQEYETPNGTVSIGFTLDMAYIKEDELGLFDTGDLMNGIKQIGLDVEGEAETVEICSESGFLPKIEELGLTEEQKNDVLERLRECAALKKDAN